MDKIFRTPILFGVFITVSVVFFYFYGHGVSQIPLAVQVVADAIAVLDMLLLVFIVRFIYLYDRAHPVDTA